ncbi:pectinesterase inhibitor-like [Tasmannia lanceolata]|uniref:pectinesterase inhibitor-like n=1 Tax=Tasmannia lanceolata TaxID=3420 RepID=UPI0040639BAC
MDTSAGLVDKICKQTHDQNTCELYLNDDPFTKTSDLNDLAHVVLDVAMNITSDSHVYIVELMNDTSDTNDIVMKQYLSGCLDEYTTCLVGIKKAFKDLDSGAYKTLGIDMVAVGREAISCEELFKGEPYRDSPLTLRNQALFNLCDISKATANLLGRMG